MDENLQEMAFNVFLAMICGERSNPKIGDELPVSTYDQLANDALSAAESFQKAVAKRAKPTGKYAKGLINHAKGE